MALKDQFEEGWWQKLSPFLNSDLFKRTALYLRGLSQEKPITPVFDDTFRAFKECPYNKLKVVLLGQDPYPTERIADGLAFSSRYKPHWSDCPKSLKYMIEAIEREVYGGFAVGFNENYMETDLTRWASQGVLLLNTALSTHVGEIGSHIKLWAPFTQYVFKTLKDNNTGLIYILLGGKAKAWMPAIDTTKNHVLTASHPSSINYSGAKQWDSEGVFIKTNELLEQMNGPEAKILW